MNLPKTMGRVKLNLPPEELLLKELLLKERENASLLLREEIRKRKRKDDPMKKRCQPDLTGNVRETSTTVRMPTRMRNAWRTICAAKGVNPNEAIRDLIEREIRMHHAMDDIGPALIPDDK